MSEDHLETMTTTGWCEAQNPSKHATWKNLHDFEKSLKARSPTRRAKPSDVWQYRCGFFTPLMKNFCWKKFGISTRRVGSDEWPSLGSKASQASHLACNTRRGMRASRVSSILVVYYKSVSQSQVLYIPTFNPITTRMSMSQYIHIQQNN